MTVTLRPVDADDSDLFFGMMRDPVAVDLVAFTKPDPDRDVFDPWFEQLRTSPDIRSFTVLRDDVPVGVVAAYNLSTAPEVTYWIVRDQWGHGIASRALGLLLQEVQVRPLVAGASADNTASRAVLRRHGFEEIGRERSIAAARGVETEAIRFRLG
jgi:RimJ/RimL family protein N-acetyltransferase